MNNRNPTFLEFKNVKKTYDQKQLVVNDFNLQVGKGEFITLLGPSGSGKTTVLMMLAGFEGVTGGDITVLGNSITETAPYKRNIGMVFQNYALFPHMTVEENLSYPLEVRSKSKEEIKARVAKYLELIELRDFGKRYPGQLSGGQRQRVALARALIFEPTLVLMDEPLGALDKKLREQMQFEISQLHANLGFTVIYVTHDQIEAMTMSDRIAVFNEGVVLQCASPSELYEKPATAFVADFIGENNLIPARIKQGKKSANNKMITVTVAGGAEITAIRGDFKANSGECILSLRPENIYLQNLDQSFENEITGKFLIKHYVGDFIRYYFKLADGSEIVAKLLNDKGAPSFEVGEATKLFWHTSDSIAFIR